MTDRFSRRDCLGRMGRVAGYGYVVNAVGWPLNRLTAGATSAIPVHSVLVNFQYEITACCPYYQGNGNFTQYPVKFQPDTKYIKVLITPPGERERELDGVPASEFLTDAHNAHWGGTFERTSSPLPNGAKGIWVMRLQALIWSSTAFNPSFCNACSNGGPSLQISASYTVLINGEQNPSLQNPYGSGHWSAAQSNKPQNQQLIWTFNVS
jgi:hypothetical protein